MSASTDFSPLGVKFSYFQQFISECGGEEAIKNKTTLEIRDQFIIPRTKKTGVSLCEQLKSTGEYSCCEASWFICHSWESKFLDTIKILKFSLSRLQGEEASQNTVIWFDLFSASQHLTSARPPDWWTKVLMKGIEVIGHMMVVTTPLTSPSFLLHTNCLFEIFCAHNTKCQLELAMKPEDAELFQTILSQNKEDYYHMLAKIDSKASVMYTAQDKENIFMALKKLLPRLNEKNLYKTVNSIVFRALEDWMIDVIKTAIRDAQNDERASIQWCMSLKQIYETHGHNELEEQIYIAEQVLSVSQRIYGDSDPDTLSLMNNLALNYLHQGRVDKAEKSLTTCLQLCRSALGPEDETTIETLDNLGLVLLTQKKYKMAEQLHLESFNLKSKLYGMDDVETISSLQNLAGVYAGLKRYELAERLYVDCLNKRTRINGALHADTNACRTLLATLYTKTKQYPLAEKLYIESCEVHKKKYGFDNHETLACVETLANFYCKIEKFEVAEKLYADIMEAGKRMLGNDCPEEYRASNYQSQGSNISSCIRISTASQISGIFDVEPTATNSSKNAGAVVSLTAEEGYEQDNFPALPVAPSTQFSLKRVSQTSTAENTAMNSSAPTTPSATTVATGTIAPSSSPKAVGSTVAVTSSNDDTSAKQTSLPASDAKLPESPTVSSKLPVESSEPLGRKPRSASQESLKQSATVSSKQSIGAADTDSSSFQPSTGPVARISIPAIPSRISAGSLSVGSAAGSPSGIAPEESPIPSPVPSISASPAQNPASSTQRSSALTAPKQSPTQVTTTAAVGTSSARSADNAGNQTDRTDDSLTTGAAVEPANSEVIELLSVVSGQLSSIAKHRRAKEIRAVTGTPGGAVPSLIEECDDEDSDYDEDEDRALEARIMDKDETEEEGSNQGRDGSIEKRRTDVWEPADSDLGIGI